MGTLWAKSDEVTPQILSRSHVRLFDGSVQTLDTLKRLRSCVSREVQARSLKKEVDTARSDHFGT